MQGPKRHITVSESIQNNPNYPPHLRISADMWVDVDLNVGGLDMLIIQSCETN